MQVFQLTEASHCLSTINNEKELNSPEKITTFTIHNFYKKHSLNR